MAGASNCSGPPGPPCAVVRVACSEGSLSIGGSAAPTTADQEQLISCCICGWQATNWRPEMINGGWQAGMRQGGGQPRCDVCACVRAAPGVWHDRASLAANIQQQPSKVISQPWSDGRRQPCRVLHHKHPAAPAQRSRPPRVPPPKPSPPLGGEGRPGSVRGGMEYGRPQRAAQPAMQALAVLPARRPALSAPQRATERCPPARW